MKNYIIHKNFCLIVLLSFALSIQAFATSYTWNGNTSTAWTTSTNWTPNGVPTSTDNVTIANGTYSPLLSANVTVNNFVISADTLDCNGDTLTINGTGLFSGGRITNGLLMPRGGTIQFTGTIINLPIDAVVTTIKLDGSVFNKKCYLEATSIIPGTSAGGNTFNDTVTIKRSYTGNGIMYLGNSSGNVFNKLVTLINLGTKEIETTTTGGSKFNENVVVENALSGGINFGATTAGKDTLASGKTITIGSGGFTTGVLTLRNFVQLGNTAQSLTVTSSAIINLLSCTFNGNLSLTAPGVLCKASTFNGTFTSVSNGTANTSWSGYNIFNSTASITNTSTTGDIRLDNDSANTFYGNLTLTTSSSKEIKMCFSSTTTSVYGNVTGNNALVTFNSGTGTLAFRGSNVQTFNSPGAIVKDVLLKKTANSVTLDTTLTCTATFTFNKGNIITTSSHLLVFNAGSSASGASDTSFVSGPVKKVGNTSFTFPIGDSYYHRALNMTAPGNSSDAFIAQYFNAEHSYDIHSRDNTFDYVNSNNYWTLDRINGTSQIKPTLYWNSNGGIPDTGRVKITRWDGSQWANIGAVTRTGNKSVGSVSATSNINSFGTFTLAYTTMTFNSCGSTAHNYPDLYYTFDNANLDAYSSVDPNSLTSLSNYMQGAVITTSNEHLTSIVSGGVNGNCYFAQRSNNDLYGGTFQFEPNGYFAVEMYVKFNKEFSDQTSSFFFRISTNGASNGVVHQALIDRNEIQFYTGYSGVSGDTYQSFSVALDGENEKSIGYYTDNNWHHFCFVNKPITNGYRKEIWVDGKLYDGFKREIINSSITGIDGTGAGGLYIILKTDAAYNNFAGNFDQVAVYTSSEICPKVIEDHGMNQASYDFTDISTPYSTLTITNASQYDENDYPLNYAPGTNQYGEVKSAILQLEGYPLPRYKVGHTLRRNFNWMASDYLGGHFYVSDGAAATQGVDIQKEFHNNWHYLFNSIEGTSSWGNVFNTEFATEVDNNPTIYETGIITNRNHIDYPTSFTYPVGGTTVPTAPPYDSWITNQDIPTLLTSGTLQDYYLVNSNGVPFYPPEQEFSPNATRMFWNYSSTSDILDYPVRRALYENDGKLQNYLIHQILNSYGNVFNNLKVISENNETTPKIPYGLVDGPSGLEDIAILADAFSDWRVDNGSLPHDRCNWETFLAERKKELDNDYRDEYFDNTAYTSPPFSDFKNDNVLYLNYAVDGNDYIYQGNCATLSTLPRWDYNEMRLTQSDMGSGVRMPTPDIYPLHAQNWLATKGDRHGFKWVTNGRIKEIAAGDLRYAPFVSAGYGDLEEDNLRPGQWLGFLKCLGMLGVDFFHVGHFKQNTSYNSTNLLPPDPKGYIWHSAAPIYAHAIASRYENYLTGGQLLFGDLLQDFEVSSTQKMYAFNGGSPDMVIVARQLNSVEKYVITGTVQPNSNVKNNALLEKEAKIDLVGSATSYADLQFNIRRQGSTYIFDATANPYVFYQLDAWHDYKHPDRWSKDFWFDAEVFDNASTAEIKTEDENNAPITNGDYTDFTSYIQMNNGEVADYKFHPRKNNTDYYVWFKMRKNGASACSLKVELVNAGSPVCTLTCVDNALPWKWYKFLPSTMAPILLSNLQNQDYTLRLTCMGGVVEIDKIVIAEDKNLALQPQPDFCSSFANVCSPTTFTINSGNAASVASTGSGALTSQIVLLTADFTVNTSTPFDFTGKTVICSTGVKIIVPATASLTIDNSHFFACSTLWDGIELEDGTSELIIDNSVIEDATKAINILDDATAISNITLSNTTFDHNDVGIYSVNTSSRDFDNMSVEGCTFRCKDRDLHGLSHISSQHICIAKGTNLKIGNGAGAQNHFEHASTGITLIDPGILEITNNYIHEMELPPPASKRTGFGITIINSSFGSSASSATREISFNNIEANDYGIISTGIPLNIHDNTLASNTTKGIEFRYCYNGIDNIEINNNSISQSTQDVSINRCTNNTINITDNTCYVHHTPNLSYYTANIDINSIATSPNTIEIDNNILNADGDYGIRVVNEPNLATPVKITNNQITGARIGIHAINSPGINIGFSNGSLAANTIAMEAGDGAGLTRIHTGIFLQACNNAVVKANDVYNNSVVTTSIDSVRGIAAENSQDMIFCGNDVTRFGNALRFAGNSQLTRLKNNVITDYYEGVHLELADFPQQGNASDPWNNEWQRSDNNYAGFNKSGGSFFPTGNRDWYYSGTVSISYPFSPDPSSLTITSINTSAASINCTTALLNDNDFDRDLEFGPVIGDTAVYDVFEDQAKYLAREALFKWLNADTSRLTVGSGADASFHTFYNSYLADNIGRFDSVRLAINSGNLVDADAINDVISEDNDIEINTRFIYSIILDKLAAGDSLDGSDTSALESIFAQHWLLAGNSVYMAAALLGKEYYSPELPAPRIMQQLYNESILSQAEMPGEITLFPNPAFNTIGFAGDVSPDAIVKVYDAAGRLVLTSNYQNEIDVDRIEEGFYVVKIYNSQQLLFNKTLIKIK